GVFAWRNLPGKPKVIRAYLAPPENAAYQFVGAGLGVPALSPDGTRLAFVARRNDGIPMLFVRPLASIKALPLSGTEAASAPFWSPDGRSIGFFSGGRLRKIDAIGGPPLSLADAPAARGGTWSPEGVIVFSPDQSGPLLRVSASGGPATPVTKLDDSIGESTHRWPSFLPDGKHFLYFARVVQRDEHNAAKIGSIDGAEGRSLVSTEANVQYAGGYLLFGRETTLMAQAFDLGSLTLRGDPFPVANELQADFAFSQMTFAASEDGVLVYQTGETTSGSELTWFDRGGKPLGILGTRSLFFGHSMSADAKTVIATLIDQRGVGASDLWTIDVTRGVMSRFTFNPGADNWPVITPDGREVFFSALRKGKNRADLYRKSVAGAKEDQIFVQSERDKYATQVTPDGKTVVFYTRGDPRTKADIWIAPIAGGEPRLILSSEYTESYGTVSPDMRWMAYESDESGRAEVYVCTFPVPTRKWQISSAGGEKPHWRGDTREIVFLSADGKLTSVPVTPSANDFVVGAPTTLFAIQAQRPGNVFEMAPDGHRFLVNRSVVDANAQPLTLVVPWTADIVRP
ncbi:MAG TPA: hypothetical protein VJV75_06155, partial [Candidatus Polarisedimenticolia bacterium]|nr:hypothetical protein [Candidatus Polarisedimenticolia bacterium]